jgi:hypothetical protein
MEYVSRIEWGAKYPDRFGDATRPAAGTLGHHTVTANPLNHSWCYVVMRGIEEQHHQQWGGTVGYHGVHCPHGYRFQGTPDNRTGAHQKGANRTHMGEAFMGNFTLVEPTIEAKRSFKAAVKGPVTGHRDWKPTACPGNKAYDWIRAGMPMPIEVPVEEEIDMVEAISTSAGGYINVFYVSPDRHVRQKWSSDFGKTWGESDLGDELIGLVGVREEGSYTVVIAVAPDRTLWTNRYVGGPGWEGWMPLGGTVIKI